MLRVREYGSSGPTVIVLHGGPGAPGYLAPVAAALASAFRVLEPFQRGSGGERLSVRRHVEDLDELIESSCRDEKPALVGHSWGAMLALAYAADHPDRASRLALVGCGTFDARSRERLQENRERRMPDDVRRRLAALPAVVSDRDRRLAEQGNLLLRVDSVDPISAEIGAVACDARAHDESWTDMLRLQDERVYPAAFGVIRIPVLLLHGADDPHPGSLIRASLLPHLPQLEYRELARCGHYPWLERAAARSFEEALREWLLRPLPVAGERDLASRTDGATAGLELQISGERYTIVRLHPDDPLPEWVGGPFWSVTRTEEEFSIVSLASVVPPAARAAGTWRCIRIRGAIPLASVGVLASLADPLREAEVPLFALSTHDTDYVFVPEAQLARAQQALLEAGHTLIEVSG